MPVDMKQLLRRMADEIETAEVSDTLEERFAKLEARAEGGGQITTAQIIAALDSATDEELEALHGTVVDRLAREVEERREAAANGGNEGKEEEEQEPPPPARRTRPGRKQGRAYDWELDDDGQLQRIPVARVWNEPDEPDEVELLDPPAPPAGEEEE